MSGSHQFPPWDFHGDGDGESEGHAGGFRPQSSESDFLSEFFSPLNPDFSPRTDHADPDKAAAGDATADGHHGRDEEVESSGVCKEQRVYRGASTSGGKRPQEGGGNRCPQPKRKRNRTTEMHNMTERRRRDKIKRKLKALQELIPNSQKLDRASLLDEAIAYVKSLQLQIQIMQGSGGMCRSSPCLSPGAIHCLHFSPCSHMGMGYGMGMTTRPLPLHSPLISVPSPIPMAGAAAANMVPMPLPAGFSTIPTYCPLSQPMPFLPLPEQHLAAAAGMHAIPSPPILQAGPFSSQHRGETSSQEAALNQKPNVSEPISSTC